VRGYKASRFPFDRSLTAVDFLVQFTALG